MIIIVWFIAENYWNYFGYTMFWITAECSISLFTSVMKIVFKFTLIFINSVFMLEHFLFLFFEIWQFWLLCNCCCSFVNFIIFIFSKLITFIECSLNVSQNILMQSWPLYASPLFSRPSNVHIHYQVLFYCFVAG